MKFTLTSHTTGNEFAYEPRPSVRKGGYYAGPDLGVREPLSGASSARCLSG